MSYMNVRIEHNGIDVTQYLDNYTRQQKICTGIGTLEVSFIDTITTTFEPWDTIELFEEDSQKGHYFVDTVVKGIPDSLVVVSCRDGSKKLMDYFIAESYYIDYPSYNKFWIEKFLEEAQVNYEFNVDSPGTLLSNNTSLGTASAYDQIIPLLQMSGWYIHFDANGKAVIGTLQTSLSGSHLSLGKEDILNIKVSKNDRMLRNRVVVWGGIDDTTKLLVSAEVLTHTPWNYDDSDLRTAVISNSGIPSIEVAGSIANMALAEFAQITVEKSIECIGARDIAIGGFVHVNSDVFVGLGLATTVGSTLSKEGFKTILILDERCPRLFAFYDFGDLVYVSTMGEGVWRKYLTSDPTWYPYSIGLGDTSKVTDLDKNDGILSCVTISGQAFFSIETSAVWYPISIANLTTVMPDVSGVLLPTPSVYSGQLTARAVTHDRVTNNIKIAVSANTADNYIDYATGFTTLSSGIVPRSWIVAFNPTVEAIEAVYPIHSDDYYDYDVFDIENDGAFDYVTVATSGFILSKLDKNYLYGISEGTQFQSVEDNRVSYTTLKVPILDYNVLLGEEVSGITNDTLCTYDTDAFKGVVGVAREIDNSSQIIFGRFLAPTEIAFDEVFDVEIPTNLRVLGIHQVTKYEYTIFSESGVNTYEFGTIRFHEESYSVESTFVIEKEEGEHSMYVYMEGTGVQRASTENKNAVWGIKIQDVDYGAKVYGLKVDLLSSSYTETLILNALGSPTKPTKISHRATISPLTDGILAKVGRLDLELNTYNQVVDARMKVINFMGPNFARTEEDPVPTSIEFHRWHPSEVAISIVSNDSAKSVAGHMAYMWASSLFQREHFYVQSAFPLQEGYYATGVKRTLKIGNDYHGNFVPVWQAGPNFSDTILGEAGNAARFGIYDFYTGDLIHAFNVPSAFLGLSFLPHIDSINGHIYIFARHVETGDAYLLDYTESGDYERSILLSVSEEVGKLSSSGNAIQNAANWLILRGDRGTQVLYIDVYNLSFLPIVNYKILRREESDFKMIKSDFLNMRLDDSLGMPLISVSDTLKTTSLMRNYTASGVPLAVSNIVSNGPLEKQKVHDFRYTSTGILAPSGIIPPSGIIVGSGIAGNNFIFASDVGIGTIPMGDSLDLSEYQIVFGSEAPNTVSRLETTNYKFPNQMIFAVTSGEAGNRFFQSDPLLSGFAEHTVGFPQTVVTRIRVDDRL